MTDRGELLLDTRRRELARPGPDPRGDVHRLDGADRRHADARAPGQEFIGGASAGAARVRVADVGGEEFEEAHAGAIAGGGDKRRECCRSDRDQLFHFTASCIAGLHTFSIASTMELSRWRIGSSSDISQITFCQCSIEAGAVPKSRWWCVIRSIRTPTRISPWILRKTMYGSAAAAPKFAINR